MIYKSTKMPSHTPAASTPISRADLPAWVYAKPEPVVHVAEPQAPADALDKLLTRAETAQYLRVSDRTVSRLIRTGKLPASRIGRAVRIRNVDLLEMLDRKPSISGALDVYRE